MVQEFDLKTATRNNIEPPQDFVRWALKEKQGDKLPKGIRIYKNRFRAFIFIEGKEKLVESFDNLEDAILSRQQAEKEKQEYLQNKLMSTPKLYNSSGQCIFKVKETEIIIDEEMYYDIIKYKWHKRPYGYYYGYVNGKNISLSKFVMNYSGIDYIDHINRNPLDNRRENLRIVTPAQNMMNKSSSKGSSSKYVGVHKKGNKFKAQIRVDGENIVLGTYDDEIKAAKARDLATKEHYGEYGNLNFLDEINV